MLKVDLHTHTADDPVDWIPHTTTQLIDRAALLGYHALGITLHDRQLDLRRVTAYAAERGIVLIPGIERTIEGRHVLLLNFRRGAEDVRTFAELASLRHRERGLVIAPHPFFPARCSLWGYLDRHADLFDAVEWNAMFTTAINFNRRAARWAARHGKPLVGNGDVHRLGQLGTSYSQIDAALHPEAICEAVAAGRLDLERRPLTGYQATRLVSTLLLNGFVRRSAATAAEGQINERMEVPEINQASSSPRSRRS